jgi:hypothetical protein
MNNSGKEYFGRGGTKRFGHDTACRSRRNFNSGKRRKSRREVVQRNMIRLGTGANSTAHEDEWEMSVSSYVLLQFTLGAATSGRATYAERSVR